MNMTAFWITWFVLSAILRLASNHQMNKRVNRMHELNEQLKGDK